MLYSADRLGRVRELRAAVCNEEGVIPGAYLITVVPRRYGVAVIGDEPVGLFSMPSRKAIPWTTIVSGS